MQTLKHRLHLHHSPTNSQCVLKLAKHQQPLCRSALPRDAKFTRQINDNAVLHLTRNRKISGLILTCCYYLSVLVCAEILCYTYEFHASLKKLRQCI